MHPKILVFLEDVRDAERFVASRRFASQERDAFLCVGMTPAVQALLGRHGYPVTNTVSYFTEASHAKALEESDRLVRWLREEATVCDPGTGATQGIKDPFILFVRCAVHYCLWVVEVVSNAIERHEAHRLVASCAGGTSLSSLFIQSDERVLGALVKLIAEQRGLAYDDIGETRRHWPAAVGHRLRSHAAFFVKRAAFTKWVHTLARTYRGAAARPVLFTSPQYQMDRLMRELQARHPDAPLIMLTPPIIASYTLPRLVQRLCAGRAAAPLAAQARWFRDFSLRLRGEARRFSFRGVSFAALVARKIETGISHHALGLMAWSTMLAEALEALRPSAVVSSGCRWDDVLIGELCQAKGIKAILISHGSHVLPKSACERIEWGEHGRGLLRAPFSHVALQTPMAEGYRQAFPSRAASVKTGPVLWGVPIQSARSRALFEELCGSRYEYGRVKVVVHAGSPKRRSGLRFCVYETADEYLEALRDLARAVEQVPETVLVIRFRPSEEISVQDLRALVPFSDRVILSTEKPFADVLGMTDLLVSFSSTTIEEALQNRIPVLLYGGGGRYQHVPAQTVQADRPLEMAPVYHVREAGELPHALSQILEVKRAAEAGRYRQVFDVHVYREEGLTSVGALLNL